MAHFLSRLDTSPDPYSLFPDAPEHSVWARTPAHPGYEQQAMASGNLPSHPNGLSPFSGSGTSQNGAHFQSNVVSIYTLRNMRILTTRSP